MIKVTVNGNENQINRNVTGQETVNANVMREINNKSEINESNVNRVRGGAGAVCKRSGRRCRRV